MGAEGLLAAGPSPVSWPEFSIRAAHLLWGGEPAEDSLFRIFGLPQSYPFTAYSGAFLCHLPPQEGWRQSGCTPKSLKASPARPLLQGDMAGEPAETLPLPTMAGICLSLFLSSSYSPEPTGCFSPSGSQGWVKLISLQPVSFLLLKPLLLKSQMVYCVGTQGMSLA